MDFYVALMVPSSLVDDFDFDNLEEILQQLRFSDIR